MHKGLMIGLLAGTIVGCSSTPEISDPGVIAKVQETEEWCTVVKPVPVQTAGRALIEAGPDFFYAKCDPYQADQLTDIALVSADKVTLPSYARLVGFAKPSMARQLKRHYYRAVYAPTQDNVDAYLALYAEASKLEAYRSYQAARGQ